MAIIKLNFLAQAIELSLDDNQIVKKKLVDAHYPIRLKKIMPLSNMVVNSEAKLVIETNAPTKPTPTSATSSTNTIATSTVPTSMSASDSSTSSASNKKIVASAEENGKASIPQNPVPSPKIPIPADNNTGGPKKNLLAVLQQKYGKEYEIEEVKESIPLDMKLLKQCWDEYALHLEANDKHASSGTFKVAQLNILDDIHFTVTVGALTAQKFVEQERMSFLEIIWNAFQNRAIQFDVLVEAGEQEDVPSVPARVIGPRAPRASKEEGEESQIGGGPAGRLCHEHL